MFIVFYQNQNALAPFDFSFDPSRAYRNKSEKGNVWDYVRLYVFIILFMYNNV
jgi:hypothetical protein